MEYFLKKILVILIGGLSIQNTIAQIWTETQKVVASDRDEEDNFGWATAIDSNIFIIGAPYESHDTIGKNTQTQAGSAYLFEQNTQGEWSQVQKLIASDRSFASYFGWAVDLAGDYAVIGARGERKNTIGKDTLVGSGAVYIFKKNENHVWAQVQKLVASDREARDNFGSSVALSDSFLVVGAPGEQHDTLGQNTIDQAGSAYIFEKDHNGTWIEIQKITPSDRGIYDQFGFSVDISAQFAVIGAHTKIDYVDGIPVFEAGAAYIFERNSSNIWTEAEKLVAAEQGESDFFGCSVSISGNTVLVGAFGDDHIPGGSIPIATGAAYFFERNSNNHWEEKQVVFPYDYGTGPQFGRSVSVDGNGAIIGAREDSRDQQGSQIAVFAGSAFIFEKNAQNIWQPIQKVAATDRDTQDYFGSSVAISGGTAIVGAIYEDEDTTLGNTVKNAGSAYIFERWAPVSISETSSSFPVNIYPNPTAGRLFIEIDQIYPDGQIRLYNANGQMVLQKEMGQLRETEIQINGPAGIYGLVMQTDPGTAKTIKVVKQ